MANFADHLDEVNLRQFYDRLWQRQPGEAVALKVLRDSDIHLIEVAAGDRYEFYL